jgi:SAM-dependent methyltransferase
MLGLFKKIIPPNVRIWLREFRSDYQTRRSPDRVVLVKEIIPALLRTPEFTVGADVLWIGCRRYTKDYYRLLEKNGARCWTIDIDKSVSRWGHSDRHVTGDIRTLKEIFTDKHFDAIFCNGIFGWGIDTTNAQREATEAMAAVSKPNGWMLLGWDINRIPDPIHTVTPWFERFSLSEFGERKIIEGYYKHVYDVFRRR